MTLIPKFNAFSWRSNCIIERTEDLDFLKTQSQEYADLINKNDFNSIHPIFNSFELTSIQFNSSVRHVNSIHLQFNSFSIHFKNTVNSIQFMTREIIGQFNSIHGPRNYRPIQFNSSIHFQFTFGVLAQRNSE